MEKNTPNRKGLQELNELIQRLNGNIQKQMEGSKPEKEIPFESSNSIPSDGEKVNESVKTIKDLIEHYQNKCVEAPSQGRKSSIISSVDIHKWLKLWSKKIEHEPVELHGFKLDILQFSISGETEKLKMAILFLLDVSHFFTPEGIIKVNLSPLKISNYINAIRIEVVDTGRSIPYYCRNMMDWNDADSLGIVPSYIKPVGNKLMATYQILKSMGVTLNVDQREGQGTRYYFDLIQRSTRKNTGNRVHFSLNEINFN